MLYRVISVFLLSVMLSLVGMNVYHLSDFALNQKKISEELCVNLDTDITQCKGMCYLADQVEEDQNLNDLDYTNANGGLNFLFYFCYDVEVNPKGQEQLQHVFYQNDQHEQKMHYPIFVPPSIA